MHHKVLRDRLTFPLIFQLWRPPNYTCNRTQESRVRLPPAFVALSPLKPWGVPHPDQTNLCFSPLFSPLANLECLPCYLNWRGHNHPTRAPQSPQRSPPSLNPQAGHWSLGCSQDTDSSSVPTVNILHLGTGSDLRFSRYFLTLLWTIRGFFTLPWVLRCHPCIAHSMCVMGSNGCHGCWQSLIWWLKTSELALPQPSMSRYKLDNQVQLCLYSKSLRGRMTCFIYLTPRVAFLCLHIEGSQ